MAPIRHMAISSEDPTKGRNLDGNVFDMATSKVESDGNGRVKEKLTEPAG